ncbi:hypothetical protein BD289DRAFT_415970 [Coniella lustricola]|uniref:Magnesium chelatase n=1 Tax=Coniella lustricola TaxID=2025994 RepID=A0A2T2ZXN4_9PEZI|nr:hypothetical protein BD289DRAFT_415970 [Coniella lustricola]
MADQHTLSKVHSLSDVELACLLSLLSNEHCIISTPPSCLDDLVAELHLVCARTFGLSAAVVECSPHTTLDEFASSLLLPPAYPPVSPTTPRSFSPALARSPHDSYFPRTAAAATNPTGTTGRPLHAQIANVILAKNLNQAPKAVQIQALELLRTHRIFTKTSVQTAPKTFMLVAVLGAESGGEARVTAHLNDFFYIAHWVDPDEEGFMHLPAAYSRNSTSAAFPFSPTSPFPFTAPAPLLPTSELTHLRQLTAAVATDIDVTRYQMNIVAFLRMHRAVGGGITPQATRHLDMLCRSLAPLHGIDYVTPALVCLAARKVYLHRIAMVAPSRERSLQWGSDLAAIERLLEGWAPEDVVEDVLLLVGAPV